MRAWDNGTVSCRDHARVVTWAPFNRGNHDTGGGDGDEDGDVVDVEDRRVVGVGVAAWGDPVLT